MRRDPNESIKLLLEEIIATGEETGLQVAAYHDGKLVIDAWAGMADSSTGRKVGGETLFTVFSTTKGILYACIHLLAERGKLSYDDPVARYWPAFAARGKAGVTIRQVLDHRAGVGCAAVPRHHHNYFDRHSRAPHEAAPRTTSSRRRRTYGGRAIA